MEQEEKKKTRRRTKPLQIEEESLEFTLDPVNQKQAPLSMYEEFSVGGRRYKRVSSHHSAHARAMYEKPPILALSDSMFNLPLSLLKKDKENEYAFIPFVMSTEDGRDPVNDAASRGFWAIQKDEDPELVKRFFNVATRVHEDGNVVTFKGQLAMKRPNSWRDADLKRFQVEQQKQNEIKKAMQFGISYQEQPKSPLTNPANHMIMDY